MAAMTFVVTEQHQATNVWYFYDVVISAYVQSIVRNVSSPIVYSRPSTAFSLFLSGLAYIVSSISRP